MEEVIYTKTDVQAIVNELLGNVPINVNAAVDSTTRQRIAAAISGGYDFADTLHNIYLDYGYPISLDFFNYWNMYRRFGIARRVVELYPDQTWLDAPIIDAPEVFTRELQRIIDNFGLWRRLKGLDTRQRVGRYAGMFMRVRDGKKPSEPIDGKLNGLASLVDMVPLYESQLEVSTTENDPAKDNFGMPTMYQYNSGAVGNRNEQAGASFQIHSSRVIIASEDSDNSGIYGIPVLESVYNDLMDLRKILGGGGEGFYKNASQSVLFDLKDGASANANATLLDQFNEQFDEFSRNRFRRGMWTPGMEAKTLTSNLVNPKEFADNCLMSIAAGSNIPTALLIGNQTGRLAGDQDTKGFLSQVQSRRVDFGTDMAKAMIDWLIKYGILPTAQYNVKWPDAMAPSAGEKLTNAATMADVNQKSFLSGADRPFTPDEIRKAGGFEVAEEAEVLPDESLDDDGEED